MIKIIKRISIKRVDDIEAPWYDLDLVPATGKLEITNKCSTSGRIKEIKLSAVLSSAHPYIEDNLQVKIDSTNSEIILLGTKDVPIAFELVEDVTLKISTEYQTRA